MAGILPDFYLKSLKLEAYSDLVVECQGVEFRVHRTLLCLASPFFAAACSGSWREAGEGRVKLPEEDPEIIARVIGFLYTNDYDSYEVPDVFLSRKKPRITQTPSSGAIGEPFVQRDIKGPNGNPKRTLATKPDVVEPLRINVRMYKCADFLGITNLRQKAASRFLSMARTAVADRAFATPLRFMFESTKSDDVDLRRMAMQLCVTHYAQIELSKETLAVILEHEANAWNVAVPLLKDRARESVETFKKKLQHAVDNLELNQCSGCSSYLRNHFRKIVVVGEEDISDHSLPKLQ